MPPAQILKYLVARTCTPVGSCSIRLLDGGAGPCRVRQRRGTQAEPAAARDSNWVAGKIQQDGSYRVPLPKTGLILNKYLRNMVRRSPLPALPSLSQQAASACGAASPRHLTSAGFPAPHIAWSAACTPLLAQLTCTRHRKPTFGHRCSPASHPGNRYDGPVRNKPECELPTAVPRSHTSDSCATFRIKRKLRQKANAVT